MLNNLSRHMKLKPTPYLIIHLISFESTWLLCTHTNTRVNLPCHTAISILVSFPLAFSSIGITFFVGCCVLQYLYNNH